MDMVQLALVMTLPRFISLIAFIVSERATENIPKRHPKGLVIGRSIDR